MALSRSVMVFYVAVYFVFDSVEAVGNDAVVVVLFLEASMNKRDNNTETPSSDSSQKPRTHAITRSRCFVQLRLGFLPNIFRLLLVLLHDKFRQHKASMPCHPSLSPYTQYSPPIVAGAPAPARIEKPSYDVATLWPPPQLNVVNPFEST